MVKYLVCALLLLPNLAFAVMTKNCPKKIKLSYESVEIYDEAKLKREVEKSGRELDGGFTAKQIQADHAALVKMPSFAFREVTFDLKATTSGVCHYLRQGETRLNGDGETRIFTSNRRDFLRVALGVGRGANKSYFWVYHTVNVMGPKYLNLAKFSGVIRGYFDHGSPQIPMGWANSVDVEVVAD